MSYRTYGPYDSEDNREKASWEDPRWCKSQELRSKGYDVDESGHFEVNGKARYVDEDGRVWDIEY